MKICFITTWPPKRCGIATYTSYLSNALSKNEDVRIDVITEKENPSITNEGITVHPSFDRTTDYCDDIIPIIDKIKPDIVHIQHEFGIFGNDLRLIRLLERIRYRKIVTLHTVLVNGMYVKFPDVEPFNRLLGKSVDKIVVHQGADRDILSRQDIEDSRILVIPHGTELMPHLNQNESRKRLDLRQDIKILLLLGFLKRAKMNFSFVESLARIFKENPDIYFYIVGSACQESQKDKDYFIYVKGKLKEQGIDKKVVFLEEFISEEQIPIYYNAADAVVFPYDVHEWGASGALHLAIGSGKPVIISRIPKFDDVRMNVSEETTIIPHKTEDWARVISRVLNDKRFRDYVLNRTKHYAEKTSWSNVAKMHLNLYKAYIS